MKILITGTSQGIGKAIAERFLTEGHDVIGIDRNPSTIEHSSYTHHICDVRDYAQVCNARDTAVKAFGKIERYGL